MADEAVPVEGPYETHDFTCASGSSITKGTILKLSDPRTAAANDGSGDVFAGIAAADKSGTDYSTNISAHTKGFFDLTKHEGGAITAGQLVSTSGANLIKTATEAEIAAGKAIGKALEDGSGGSSEQIEVAVGSL